MKRPFDPIPERIAAAATTAAEGNVTESSEDLLGGGGGKREFPKRKVAMIMGYSGTGYQGMQR